jgi:hypothetical protein
LASQHIHVLAFAGATTGARVAKRSGLKKQPFD